MTYLTLGYYVLIAAAVGLYYIVPEKYRWTILFAASLCFYYFADGRGIPSLVWMIVTGYLFGRFMKPSKWFLFVSIGISLIPYWLHLLSQITSHAFAGIALPLGLSYSSLQMIAYLTDVCRETIPAEENIVQFALFHLFFPKIVQGPIARYGDLSPQLRKGHPLKEENIIIGFLRILCGLFLKFVISDRAAIGANAFYLEAGAYRGISAWIGASMYVIQLYTDFFGCVLLCQGAARLFGIVLSDNFDHPFTSQSNGEIWRRWHMTLGSFLRDYVYIPLGGSKHGSFRKYLNILAVFVISALWHGFSLTYLAWGIATALIQIIGGMTFSFRDHLYATLSIPEPVKKRIRQTVTAILFTMTTVIFRSYGLRAAVTNLKSLFSLNTSQVTPQLFGMDPVEWIILIAAMVLFVIAQRMNQNSNPEITFLDCSWGQRYCLYLAMIIVIMLFGTYGFGYDAQAFIYGGF